MRKEIETAIAEAVKAGNYKVENISNDTVIINVMVNPGDVQDAVEVSIYKGFAITSIFMYSDVLLDLFKQETSNNKKVKLASLLKEVDELKAAIEKDGE